MPEPYEAFMSSIEAIEADVFSKMPGIIKQLKAATSTELVKTMRQVNLLDYVMRSGYQEAVRQIEFDMGKAVKKVRDEATARGLGALDVSVGPQLSYLAELNTAKLLGRAKAYADDLTQALFRGIAENTPLPKIVATLQQTGLATHQLNVAVHDGFRQFDNLARGKIFEGADVRWTYIGPWDSVTRDDCAAVLGDPQNVKGWKQENLPLPFGDRGGFNCRHDWHVV